ncbi:hypothetical protein [Zoogloea sp.]|uniref:hypothetical protein n=1 Tax=Zoogloea sp. TaxID=49181 RepID=UPI0035B0E5E1
MGGKLVKDGSSRHPVPAVFEYLGLGNVKPSDELMLVMRNRTLEATVKRASGVTQTATLHIGSGGFKSMTEFDPGQMPKDERNDLIRQKHAKGERQSALAKMFGISQAMVSKIVRE